VSVHGRWPEQSPLSQRIWRSKYRYAPSNAPGERSIDETWDRVAAALSSVEPQRRTWERSFREILGDFRFLPGGRILAGAGTRRETTLANCFVIGVIDDSIDGIFENLKQSARTMQWGGGIGCDFSGVRPRGAHATTRGTIASGPVSFMNVWDAMCSTLLSTGARRGAMMGTLRCDHPDVEDFIDAKRDPRLLRNFNLSVGITDDFIAALSSDREWPLCFPSAAPDGDDTLLTEWPGTVGAVPCKVWRRVSARSLWQRITNAAYDSAEPGVLFLDRINRLNNLYYCERITTTNPCGEVPLPPHGACVLGSLNLTAFVRDPFTRSARFDIDAIERTTSVAVRLLDDAVEASRYPLPAQAAQALATRRIGLGVTGLGDALMLLGLHYEDEAARSEARRVLACIRDAAYRASTELASERGAFPLLDRDAYLDGEYARTLPDAIRDRIARNGIRNSHLLAIAPTGTVSLLANNVSSGIEPALTLEGNRRVLDDRGDPQSCEVVDYAVALWRRERGGALPKTFVTAAELTPEAHLSMVAALQPLVDGSIAKTINVAEGISRDEFGRLYQRAFDLGLKGCTVFRPNAVTGSVMEAAARAAVQCCSPDREAD
jgi:ribonucleoside-diphosphate reductase alpha chain